MKNKIQFPIDIKKYGLLVIITIISLFMIFSSGDSSDDSISMECEKENVEMLEKRLKNILSQIEGAGRVEVMITLHSEGEKIILKDTEDSANDSFFSSEEESEVKEKTVMKKDGSKEEPFVRKQTKAEIRGVIVCADGAYDEFVKSEIISSCSAVLDVPVTRIAVVKRKE